MLNESHQKPKPRRQQVPTRKRQDETSHLQIEIEKGKKKGGREEKNKDKPTSAQQERKVNISKEDCTQGEYAYFKLASTGGCSANTK